MRDRKLLLVLDNFEHMLDAAPLVADWLMDCPNLTILVTSRERLRLQGERVYHVPPLSVVASGSAPADGEAGSHARVLPMTIGAGVSTAAELAPTSEAIQLFVERAQ